MTSSSVADDGEVVDLDQLKKRFENHIPKYGKPWKSMANAERRKETTVMKRSDDKVDAISDLSSRGDLVDGVCKGGNNDKENKIPSPRLQQQDGILNAIINKQSVSLRVSPTSSPPPDHNDELCGDGCKCASPIFEIIDDDDVDDDIASTFDDVNVDAELVDTSYDDDDNDDEYLTDMRTEKKNHIEVNTLEEFILSNEDATSINTDSDDSSTINLVRSKTSNNRVFIVDSDDDEEKDDDVILSVAHGSPKKDDQSVDLDFSTDENSKQYESPVSISKAKVDVSDEQEWIELSSDEENEVSPPLKRVNKVVILSDDEEDDDGSVNTGQNDDDHSAFTISDDSNDSDNSSIRDRTIRKHVKPTTDKPRSTATFRKNRDAITSQTFFEFNKQVFHGALSSIIVTWSKKLNKTAGITRMRGKLGDGNSHTRVAAIELSTKVIDDEERLRSTLLHEMCHAAQWLVDGVHKPPHGAIFKKWASKSMSKISDVEVTTTHNYLIAYKFAWACTALNCKVVIKRHSRSVDPAKHCCGKCKGKLIEIEVPGSKGDTAKGVSHTPKVARKATDFALFVKEQGSHVRKQLALERSCTIKEISQALVMKECGKLWRSHKASSPADNESSGEPNEFGSLTDRLAASCRINNL